MANSIKKIGELISINFIFIALLIENVKAANESINITAIFDALNNSLNNIEEILLSVSVIIAAGLFIILLGLLFRWIFYSKGIFIKPFVIGSCEESYNGETISNLLIVEFQNIRQIYEAGKNNSVDKARLESNIIHSNPVPMSENLGSMLSNVNFSAGGITVSIGQLVSLIKQQTRNTDRIITGSLEQYGSTLILSAWMWIGPDKVHAWEVKDNDVPNMVRDIALKITTDIIKLEYKDSAYHLLNLGLACLEKGSYRDSENLLRESISLKSDDKTFSALADVLFEKGDHLYKRFDNAKRLVLEEAIHFYDKAIEKKINSHTAWNNKGWVLTAIAEEMENQYDSVAIDRHEQAIKCYDTAISIDNSSAKAWNNKAFSLSRIGRLKDYPDYFKEAIKCFDTAIKLDDQFKWPWMHKSWILAREFEKHNDAIGCHDKAIQIDPKFFWSWHHKGFSLYKLEKFEEAIVSYKNAIEINPRYLDSQVSLAACYRIINIKRGERWAKDKWRGECSDARKLSTDIKYEYSLARLEAVCGTIGEAINLLEISLDKKQVKISFIEKDFAFDFIRKEPAFTVFYDKFKK